MNNEEITTLVGVVTLVLATYGALLSTVLGIRELIRERRQVAIFLEHKEWSDSYSIIITNIGHRPITLVGISMGIGREAVPSMILREMDLPFPVTLNDGEHLVLQWPQRLNHEIDPFGDNVTITVYDAENREYSKLKRISHDEKYGVHRSKS